jgi:hypothetical protein
MDRHSNASVMTSPALQQPELAAIYDRIDVLASRAFAVEERLNSVGNRALGMEPQKEQGGGTVKAVPDGAVAKINEQIDSLSIALDRITGHAARLERVV